MQFAGVTPTFNDKTLIKHGAFINGEWIEQCTQHFEVRDPANNSVIAKLPDQDIDVVDTAVNHAYEAFKRYRETSPQQRAKWLRRVAELLHANAEDLGRLVTWENGKPLKEGIAEVRYSASFFEWYADEAVRIYGTTIQPMADTKLRSFTIKQPVGVCGIICPWNFPSAMIARKVAPALAAGCTVVLRPDSRTPLSALALANLIQRAGVPDGVFNVIVSTMSSEIGKALCENPIIKKLSFTGSTRVGRILMQQSGSTIKKMSLELGGNAPFIIFDDANLEEAIKHSIASKFRCFGQTCVCANRFYVHESVVDKFSQMAVEEVKKFKIGHGLNDGVTHSCLIDEAAVEKCDKHVQDAIGMGAEVILKGGRLDEYGPTFYSPTVLKNVHPKSIIAAEETFGPVMAIIPFKTMEEVIGYANDSELGLASYVFSQNIDTIYHMAEALESGMVACNTSQVGSASTPFGGIKQSGFGKEGSLHGIDEYVIVKSVTIGIPYPRI